MKKSIYLIVFLSLSLLAQAQQADSIQLRRQAQTANKMGAAAAVRDFFPNESVGNRKGLEILNKEVKSLEMKSPQRPERTSLLRADANETSGTCGANGDNLRWTFDSATGTLTISGTGEMADYDVDYPPYEFYGSQIINVVIEAGVTGIGNDAFYNYSNLVSVIIPIGVTRIGSGAFYNCSQLYSITIPESITSIGGKALYGTLWFDNQPDGCIYIGKALYAYKGSMPANTVIDVAEGTVSISDYAFYYYNNSKNLVSITLPGSLTSIGDYAFEYCFGLTTITIPENVTNIGYATFAYCSGLTSIEVASANPSYLSDNGVLFNKDKTILVCFPSGKSGSYTIPSGVTTIGDAAFIGSATSVVNIPNSVETINDYAFCNCDNLTSVTISGNSLRAIGYYSFYGCPGITSISLPEGLTSIGGWAFGYCGNLVSIAFPVSVTDIGMYAFYNTNWYDNQPYIIYINNILYTCKGSISGDIAVREGTVSISTGAFYNINGGFSITLPESVKSIGSGAFASSSVKSINIPNSVTSIEDYTFSQSFLLNSITIGSGVKSIGNRAFSLCPIRSVVLPGNLTSIGDYAFSFTYLTSITLPLNVKSIGNHAFYGNDILTSVTCNALIPPILGDWVFSPQTLIACTPVVPAASLALYQQAPGWRDFYQTEASGTCGKNLTWTLRYSDGKLTIQGTGEMDNYNIDVSNPYVTLYAPWFDYNPIITQVVIENGATSIGDYAFYFCSNLTSVTIPNSVTTIGDNTFNSCNLTSITIPNNVTSIGENAFSSCCSLTSITIPNSITSIGNFAFYDCYSLTSITIPNSITSIGDGTFYYCSSLTSVTIPSSVTSIGDYAFYYCSSLTSITIPSSVTSIGYGTFFGCSSLTSVICNVLTPLYISSSVFDGVDISACTLYVPTQSITLYQQAEVWKDFYRIVTGIKEIQATQLSVYPNPVSNSFRISGLTENTAVTILDVNGKTVLKRTVTLNETVWAGNLPNGVYFVTVNGKTMKIIKEKDF